MSPTVRALIVDDNVNDRAFAQRVLEQTFDDAQVVEVCDPQALTQALEAFNFHLVITEYQLHWGTGLDVASAIQAHHPDVPVIMFTSTSSDEIAVEAMKAGMADYVPSHRDA